MLRNLVFRQASAFLLVKMLTMTLLQLRKGNWQNNYYMLCNRRLHSIKTKHLKTFEDLRTLYLKSVK
jgi:hypothetical protein